jgi:hypothetical protein
MIDEFSFINPTPEQKSIDIENFLTPIDQIDAPSEKSMGDVLSFERSGDLSMSLASEKIDISGELGNGGSKKVYDVTIRGHNFALALPNAIDDTKTAAAKWKDALGEPENTERLRALGFITNSLCGIIPLEVNGTSFPALIMRRYQDEEFEIRDSKNPTSSVGQTPIIPEGSQATEVPRLIETLARDIANLIKENIRLKRDNFNICILNGELRIYLNDLGVVDYEEIGSEEEEAFINSYTEHTVTAFINALAEEEYQLHKQYLDASTGEIRMHLANKVREQLDT